MVYEIKLCCVLKLLKKVCIYKKEKKEKLFRSFDNKSHAI